MEKRARIFISCGQQKNSAEEDTARAVAELLSGDGFEPYIAIREQTLLGITENIFSRLRECEYFIFIDFRREKLEEDGYRGSLFSHQELAIATYLKKDVLAFRQTGVKVDDGILGFIQANCQEFEEVQLLPDAIANRVRKAQWNCRSLNELQISYNIDDVNDGMMNIAPRSLRARWYPIRVENLSHTRLATDCACYIERLVALNDGRDIPLQLVEMKWHSVTTSGVIIPPARHRRCGLFWVDRDRPNALFLNFNPHIVDFQGVHREFTISQPGDYALTVLVVSTSFAPVRKTFNVSFGQLLSDIKCTSQPE